MAIYDTMQYIKPDVITTCIGQAASMGAVLLAGGTAGKRFALPNSRIMIHQPSGGTQGQATDIQIQAEEILRIKKSLNEILANHTGQDIIDNVSINGVEFLEKFNHNYDRPITCYIDDIASRNEKIKYYGTEVNVMEQLLSIRYNAFCRYRKLTHISSNLYPNDFKNIYDIRTIDRMKEMFNIIELKGGSWRKLQCKK